MIRDLLAEMVLKEMQVTMERLELMVSLGYQDLLEIEGNLEKMGLQVSKDCPETKDPQEAKDLLECLDIKDHQENKATR